MKLRLQTHLLSAFTFASGRCRFINCFYQRCFLTAVE